MTINVNPFDAKKAIEDLSNYRDGLKQQLLLTDSMIANLEAYDKMVSPGFELLQHNPFFQLTLQTLQNFQNLGKK